MTVTSVAIFVGVFVSRQDYLKAVGVEFSGTPDEISDQECDYLYGFRWTWNHAMSTATHLAADRVPHDIDESEPLVIGIKLGVIFGAERNDNEIKKHSLQDLIQAEADFKAAVTALAATHPKIHALLAGQGPAIHYVPNDCECCS